MLGCISQQVEQGLHYTAQHRPSLKSPTRPPSFLFRRPQSLTEVEERMKMQALLTLKWALSPWDCYFSMLLMLLVSHLLTRRQSASVLAWKTSTSAMTWKYQEANADHSGIPLWATCKCLQKKRNLYSCTEMFLKWVCSTSAVCLHLLVW